MLTLEGEIALMFLKSYTGMSDDGLIEMMNGNLHMQMFCGVLIDPINPIKDGKIVSAIRNKLAHYLDTKGLQKILYGNWKGDMTNLDRCLSDATCYETNLRFPTDVKLLWEACEWLQSLMKKTCKDIGERMPRNKYNDIDKTRLAYAKQRKPKKNATKKLRCRLLALLGKQLSQWNRLLVQFQPAIHLTTDQERRVMTIREVLRQQTDHFNDTEVKHRIVSIYRPYIRPIKRGKENRPTEFGAKVNNIQIERKGKAAGLKKRQKFSSDNRRSRLIVSLCQDFDQKTFARIENLHSKIAARPYICDSKTSSETSNHVIN